MANLKSSKRDIKRIIKNTYKNSIFKNKIKNIKNKIIYLFNKKDMIETKQRINDYFSLLDKAAKKNIIHKNKVNRSKSYMAKKYIQ